MLAASISGGVPQSTTAIDNEDRNANMKVCVCDIKLVNSFSAIF